MPVAEAANAKQPAESHHRQRHAPLGIVPTFSGGRLVLHGRRPKSQTGDYKGMESRTLYFSRLLMRWPLFWPLDAAWKPESFSRPVFLRPSLLPPPPFSPLSHRISPWWGGKKI